MRSYSNDLSSKNSKLKNTSNLLQHSSISNSIENLPPPPAYLLTTTGYNHMSITPPPLTSSCKVAETVKALSAIRHQPASPSAMRRAHNLLNHQHHQQLTTATIQVSYQRDNRTSSSKQAVFVFTFISN